MAIDIPTLEQDLAALSGGTLGQVLAQLRSARDNLQAQIIAGNNADPQQDTDGLSNDFVLVNTWIRTLEAAVQPAPPPTADADLLNAMQDVDAAAAQSADLNNLLVAVDGAVKAGKGG
jgi:hypothetical protein